MGGAQISMVDRGLRACAVDLKLSQKLKRSSKLSRDGGSPFIGHRGR